MLDVCQLYAPAVCVAALLWNSTAWSSAGNWVTGPACAHTSDTRNVSPSPFHPCFASRPRRGLKKSTQSRPWAETQQPRAPLPAPWSVARLPARNRAGMVWFSGPLTAARFCSRCSCRPSHNWPLSKFLGVCPRPARSELETPCRHSAGSKAWFIS